MANSKDGVARERKSRSMPNLLAIARHWATQPNVFARKFEWSHPACFACGYSRRWWTEDGHEEMPIERQWQTCGLERCHLVAHADGGSEDVSNLVLLCARCHREAPMIGASPQPMIDWINRRQDYVTWVTQRIREEADAISPTLSQDFAAVGLSPEETQAELIDMAKALRIGYHPQGDMTATIIQCAHAFVKFYDEKNRALKSSTGMQLHDPDSQP